VSVGVDYVTFNVIMDDIVYPDGQTRMGVLGGGGPQTAFGMRLWAPRVGLDAGVGRDLPPEVRAWLSACDVDASGLHVSELATPRAWQTLEEDGRRVQVWRVPGQGLGVQLRRSVERLPQAYRRAKGFHLGVHPQDCESALIADLQALGAAVSVEVFRPADHVMSDAQVRALVSGPDLFSPNLEEAVSMFGHRPPEALLQALVDAGARRVALRMGAEGSLLAQAGSPERMHIPAVAVQVVDPVGAGNAFCGGLLVGWCETGDWTLAGKYGAVAASFVVEQVGVPVVTPAVQAEAQRRLAGLRERRL